MKSTQEFPTKPHVYSYRSELVRTFAFDREPSEDLIKRTLVENILQETEIREKEELAITNFDRMYRLLVSKLSDDEMRDIYDNWQRGELDEWRIGYYCAKHGIDIPPWSNEDIEKQTTPKRGRRLGKAALGH